MTQSPPIELATLHSLHPDAAPREIVLREDVCTIGRSAMCDIVIMHRSIVSRLHAKIERQGPRYVLSDANSANGTYVNQRRIHAPHLLQDEDVIGLGSVEAILRFSDPDPTDVATDRLYYEAKRMQFFLNQKLLNLTPQEFRLVYHLYQHVGDVCTRKSCAEAMWERSYEPGEDDEGLNRTIANIRRKMQQLDSANDPTAILKTWRTVGYEIIP